MIIRIMKISAMGFFLLLLGTVQSNGFQNRLNNKKLSQKESRQLLRDIQNNNENFDANFKLGIHYNQTREWHLSKKHLLKAYALTLTKNNFKKKAGLLYELAQTYRALGEIKACEDALKGVKNLVTAKVEIWDDVILQLAEILYLQKKFNEAMAQLAAFDYNQKSVRYEQLAGAILQAIEIDQIYLKAVEAQAKGRSTKARLLYIEIDNKFSGFRDVQERLNKIQTEFLHNEIATSADAENTNVDIRTDRGISFVKTSTNDNIKPVEHKKKSSQEKTANRNKVGTSKQSWQVSKSNTGPPKNISKSSFTRNPIKPPKNNTLNEQIKKQQYANLNAKLHSDPKLVALERTDISQPSIQISIPKAKIENPTKPRGQKKPFWAATLFVAFILTGTGLTIYLNPFFRACTLSFLGRKENALQVYEKLITEKPQMLWLYPYIAKLYDHFNRKDIKAIHAYKIIQNLKMRSNADDSFTANISNKYLSHKTTNVKIEILKKNNS